MAEELSSEEVAYLQAQTLFSGAEIAAWHERFMRQYPAGRINKHQFIDMYRHMLPAGDPSDFAEHVFRNYDRDCSGCISFREFLVSVSVTTRGTMQDKLRWMFTLIDINGDHALERKEIVTILMSIYKMQGLVEDGDTHIMAEDAALRIFKSVDRDRNDTMCQEEFVRGVVQCDVVKELTGAKQ